MRRLERRGRKAAWPPGNRSKGIGRHGESPRGRGRWEDRVCGRERRAGVRRDGRGRKAQAERRIALSGRSMKTQVAGSARLGSARLGSARLGSDEQFYQSCAFRARVKALGLRQSLTSGKHSQTSQSAAFSRTANSRPHRLVPQAGAFRGPHYKPLHRSPEKTEGYPPSGGTLAPAAAPRLVFGWPQAVACDVAFVEAH